LADDVVGCGCYIQRAAAPSHHFFGLWSHQTFVVYYAYNCQIARSTRRRRPLLVRHVIGVKLAPHPGRDAGKW